MLKSTRYWITPIDVYIVNSYSLPELKWMNEYAKDVRQRCHKHVVCSARGIAASTRLQNIFHASATRWSAMDWQSN